MTDTLGLALRHVASVLDDEGVPYMAVGGIANLVRGEPRTTLDVDVTVDPGQRSTSDFLAVAERCGTPLADDPADLAERGRVVPIRTDGGTRVDFILALLPFELDAIGRATTVDIAGDQVKVCRAEDLIVMKAVSSRPRDHEDVLGVLRRQGRALDLPWLDEAIAERSSELADAGLAERWTLAKAAAGLS